MLMAVHTRARYVPAFPTVAGAVAYRVVHGTKADSNLENNTEETPCTGLMVLYTKVTLEMAKSQDSAKNIVLTDHFAMKVYFVMAGC